MVKLTSIIVLGLCIALAYAAGDCPSYSKVTNCSPKCLQDTECSAIGGKCCPNLCNARSCVQSNQLGNGGDDSKYGNNKNSGSGSYCGNTKCNSFEKCGTDRNTKRPACVRQ